MRPFAALSALALFFVLASAASGAGPWLGVTTNDPGLAAPNAAVEYVATDTGSSTTVLARRSSSGATLASVKLPGRWGMPMVTFNGDVGGLSTNGRVLVLAQPYTGGGELRSSSAFTVVRTQPLSVRATVRIRGDFGYDALSPDGGTLFLIQHASQEDLLSYRVRAYDLRAGKLLPGVIADKRQESWVMNGMPVARATSTDGRWVYTLYSGSDNYPFVHALDTRLRTAVCVGLPWQWSTAGDEISSADLRLSAGRLVVAGAHGFGTRFALDTRTFQVTKL
jgi:hypothetical protein